MITIMSRSSAERLIIFKRLHRAVRREEPQKDPKWTPAPGIRGSVPETDHFVRVTRPIIVLVIIVSSLIWLSGCAKSTTSGTGQGSSSASRKALSAQDAALLAARLANEQCDRQYQKRPFRPAQHPPILQDGLYHWGVWTLARQEDFLRPSLFIRTVASLMWKFIFRAIV